MPLTKRRVTTTADGTGDGSFADPWTLTQAFASAVAGDLVIIEPGTYARTANDTVANSGTAIVPLIFRGGTWANDGLDGYAGRTNGSGPLITSSMPLIQYDAGFGVASVVRSYQKFENLNIAGNVNTTLLPVPNLSDAENCRVLNSSTASSAIAINLGSTASTAVNCDAECLGNFTALNMGNTALAYGCRVRCATGSAIRVASVTPVVVSRCQIFDSGSGISLQPSGAGASASTIDGCTFYNISTACIATRDLATWNNKLRVFNCHATDSGKFYSNLHAATNVLPTMLRNNRTRDNTNADDALGGWGETGRVTTDTGGPETDYVNAASGDFRLIPAAPGRRAGFSDNIDIGAVQNTTPSRPSNPFFQQVIG